MLDVAEWKPSDEHKGTLTLAFGTYETVVEDMSAHDAGRLWEFIAASNRAARRDALTLMGERLSFQLNQQIAQYL